MLNRETGLLTHRFVFRSLVHYYQQLSFEKVYIKTRIKKVCQDDIIKTLENTLSKNIREKQIMLEINIIINILKISCVLKLNKRVCNKMTIKALILKDH